MASALDDELPPRDEYIPADRGFSEVALRTPPVRRWIERIENVRDLFNLDWPSSTGNVVTGANSALPPQDEFIPSLRPDPGYAEPPRLGTRPMPAGDVVLRPGGESFEGGALSGNTGVAPYIPRVSASPDTRDYDTYRAQGQPEQITRTHPLTGQQLNYDAQGQPLGLAQRISYAGDVLSPYARGNAQLGAPSSVEGVKDIFADRIKTMVADMPPDIAQKFGIISGFRDATRQHQVNPSVTNSRHSYGMAVDTTSDPDVLNWINGTNGKYGVDYTLRHLPGEQNHLEMVENGARAPLSSGNAPSAKPAEPTQPPSAAAADRAQEVATDQPSQLHPVFAYEAALEQFPVLHSQQLISGPGKQLEYWAPNEPGTPNRPRPDYIPIDQAGMELGPNSTPMDILGDIVSHHMVKKDPVIKKHFESFKESLTDDQKEQLQAQYNYAVKNQKETRPYAAWEKSTGLPAYFRGYAFGQWPAEFNQKAYTSAQRYHFDRMMDYLRGNTHQDRSALEGPTQMAQLNLTPPQPPPANPDDYSRRLPLNPDIPPATDERGFEPLVDVQGSITMNRNLREKPAYGGFRGMYRENIPF